MQALPAQEAGRRLRGRGRLTSQSEIESLRSEVVSLRKEVKTLKEFVSALYEMINEEDDSEYEPDENFSGGMEFGRTNT